MSKTQMFYSHLEDGSVPITVRRGSNRSYEAAGMVFPSARQLLIALTNHPKARNWTFDRYFKTGRFTPPEISIEGNNPPEGGTVTDLFGISGGEEKEALVRARGEHLSDLTVVGQEEFIQQRLCTVAQSRPRWSLDQSLHCSTKPIEVQPADWSPDITILELLQSPVVDEGLTVGLQVPPESEEPLQGISGAPVLGIDLERRSHEVVKLLFKGFGRKIHTAGYEPDDVIQEVFKGILVRNHGRCPWDSRKSSFGHYVWMVCACVMANYHRKQCRRRAVEQVGMFGYRDGRRTLVNVGSDEVFYPRGFLPQGGLNGSLALFDLAAHLRNSRKAQSSDGRLAIRLLPLVHAGYTQAEMAKEVGLCKMTVLKALDLLKVQALRWSKAQQPG